MAELRSRQTEIFMAVLVAVDGALRNEITGPAFLEDRRWRYCHELDPCAV
jgi:hypothetical protein